MLSIERLKEILKRFDNLNITVIGDVMLDEYLIGNVMRISPEAPVPVVNITSERFVLGGAANVLNNIQRLGIKTSIIGVIGDDDYGKKFYKELQDKHVDLSGIIVDHSRPTILKSRVLSQGQQLLRLDWEKDIEISHEIELEIINRLNQQIENIDAIILSDYNKGLLTTFVSTEIIKIAKKYNKIIVVDPKPSNFKNYVNATAMTPNRKEVLDYLGISKFQNEEDLTDRMLQLRRELQLEKLILTRSEEGISMFDEKAERVPTVAREVFDVTGAGDTFISVFTAAIAAGANWSEAARIGNTASGLVVGKVGTETLTQTELLKFYHDIFEKLN